MSDFPFLLEFCDLCIVFDVVPSRTSGAVVGMDTDDTQSADSALSDTAQDGSNVQVRQRIIIGDWTVIEKTAESEVNERYGPAANKANRVKLGNQYGPAIHVPIKDFIKMKFQNVQLRSLAEGFRINEQ